MAFFFFGGGKRILAAEEIKAKPSPFHHRESNANGISKLKYIYWTRGNNFPVKICQK